MFERVIAQTIQKISSEVLRERSSIPLTDILEDDRIPSRLKPFFATEVRWWLYNEETARGANKRFDYDHPEVASLLSYLEQVQFRHARFEREEFLAVLDSAVKLTFNYLCRPQTTLKWYIFRGQPVKPLREVTMRLDTFVDYEYFGAVFAEWVERKQRERSTFEAISATEFERIIRRTDDQILLSCTIEELIGLMDPIFDFIGEGDELHVPIDALIIFFDDKNIARLVDHLESFRERGATTVSRDGFLGVLEELLSSADENPEADFSNVYQNDELDDVVRQHLQSEGRPVGESPIDGPASVESVSRPEPESPSDPGPRPTSPPVDVSPTRIADEARYEAPTATPHASQPVMAIADTLPEESPALEIQEPPVVDSEEPLPAPASEPAAPEEPEPQPFDATGTTNDVNDVPVTEGMVAHGWIVTGNDQPDVSEGPISSHEQNGDHGHQNGSAADHDETPSSIAAEPGQVEPQREPEPTSRTDETSEKREEQSQSSAPEERPAIEEKAPTAGRSASTEELRLPRPATLSGLEDVRTFIDAMLERKIIKKVFAKNRAEYEAMLNRLNEAADWKGASKLLDEIFIKYDVDPYSRTALRFTDSVYARYLPGR